MRDGLIADQRRRVLAAHQFCGAVERVAHDCVVLALPIADDAAIREPESDRSARRDAFLAERQTHSVSKAHRPHGVVIMRLPRQS